MENKIICERARKIQKQVFAFLSERKKCRVKNPVPPGTDKYLYAGPPRPGLIPFILSLFLISLAWILPLQAAATSIPVSGFAWSDTIGWIKFNPAFGGVQFDDATGVFSGYAWSENIGWIDFAPAGSYPSSPNYSACLDLPGAGQACDGTGDYTVSGWARALSFGGGWDGWIKLRGTNYGVTLDTAASPAEFRGYAWGSDVVGWISFNCSNTGVCGTSNYKVTTALALNQPPSANNPSENLNYCAWGASPQVAQGVSVTLNWTFSDSNPDDTQSAYEVWVDDDSSFSDPKFNYLVDPSSSTAYVLNLGNDQAPGDWWASLDFGANYYWKVRVRDNNGSWSNWSSVDSFTLPPHAAPNINFSWSPLNPGVNEKITFTDSSSVYGGKSDWSWTFAPDGNPFSSEKETPTSKFRDTGQKTITLELRDSDALVCGGSKTLNIQLPLPEWREIPPFSWVNKLLAMVTSLF